MSDPKLGTHYVPVLYSLNQLKKMQERVVSRNTLQKPVQGEKEKCPQNSSVVNVTSKSTLSNVNMNNPFTHIIDNDSSDDDEISVISVKIASKPAQKLVNSSFETTLMKNFSVKASENELQNISLNVPTTTKVNLCVPVENRNQSKIAPETSNSSISNIKEFSLDNEQTSNYRSATAKPIPVVSKPRKGLFDSPLDTLKMEIYKNKKVKNELKFGNTNLTSGNEKTVLVKQEWIENLQKELVEMEDKFKTLNKKDSEIFELRKSVDIVTKESEIHAKTADNNEKELNKVKASFIERNLEIKNLQNKYVLLTKDYRKSEEMRRDNEKVIDNLKQEKEEMGVIIDSLKTDLKVLPGKEKIIEELQSEVVVLTERNEEFEHLKIKVLPEKDNIIAGLKRKVTLLGETEKVISEQKIVVQQLKEKLREKEIDSDTLLEENNKKISEKESTLQQKNIELTEKDNIIQDLQQSANELLDRANELQTKLNEKDKDMSKKEEIIEYFEAKVNEISGKEKDFEDFKKKVFTEKEEHEKEVFQLIEKSKDFEVMITNLQSEREKVCELETRIIELTKEKSQIQELNHSYDLKINSLKSELLEANMSNMYNDDDETQADEAKKKLDILSREKEELLEQNSKLLADISAKEEEKCALANENEIKISSLQSMIAENESSLRTKKEMNVKLQDIIDDLEKKHSEKEESILNFNLKMDELCQSKEFIEKEAKIEIARCEDKVKWLDNKLNDKRKQLASTSESHKIITKKYAALKTEKAYLIKEVRNVSALQIKNKSLEEEVRNVSALQIKIKSLEEQLLKAREENGDEPGLIIDDKVVDDEPSTSTSAKSSSPAKIPVSGRSLSSRDPRRKSAEARQTSEIMNLSSTEPNSSKEMVEQLTTMSGEPSKPLPSVYTPNIHNPDIPSNTGQPQEGVLHQRIKIDDFKPPLPFYSIFDVKTPPPPPPPFSQLTDALTVPLPNSNNTSKSYVSEDLNVPPPMPFSNSAHSLTSHLNPGLSQLSTWMTKNTVKNASEYRPLSTSSVPQNEPAPTASNNFYSTQNVIDYNSQSRSDWPQKRSRSRSGERDMEERYGSRTREDDVYHQRGSIYRDRERRNDRKYYDRSYEYYYRKETRNSGENSPRGKKWKTEEQKVYENANWNVVPNKYLNF